MGLLGAKFPPFVCNGESGKCFNFKADCHVLPCLLEMMLWGAWSSEEQRLVASPVTELPASSLASGNSMGDVEQNPLSCSGEHSTHPTAVQSIPPAPLVPPLPSPWHFAGWAVGMVMLMGISLAHIALPTPHIPAKIHWSSQEVVQLPAFAPAHSSAWEQSPGAASSTFPGPKSPITGFWPCGGHHQSIPW